MDIKRMHEMIEKLSEAAECELNKGIENVDTCEMDKVVDMMKDLSEAMYYRTLTKAMQESDTEEIMEMFDRYGDGGKRYYDMWRYKSGRFAPKGRGTRRGYDEPPYYHMTPDMYREHDQEYWRDMDRKDGKMYYTEPITMDKTHDVREGKSGMSRRSYMETKEMHKSNTPEDKQQKMKELEKYMGELSTDITEMISDASPEERNLLKQKLQVLTQKIG